MDIRRARADDLPAFSDVCLRTGLAGDDATGLFDEADLLGLVYVGPYLALDGTAGFAAVDVDGVAGYVLAALDTRSFESACERDWWPQLRARFPPPARPFQRADDHVIAHIHEPPITPDEIVDEYPAHLHIDLLPRAQGRGTGKRMIDVLMGELRDAEVGGVHLGVSSRNERATGFYEHLGFATLVTTSAERVMGLRLD